MAHIVKVNLIASKLSDMLEVEVKPTTIENQVVILSFGSSQFVSFVDSRNRTHDENVAINGSQNPAKIQKSFSQT